MIWIAVGVFVLAGIVVLLQRRELAHLQSLLSGGTVAPGCIVAEAIALFILAGIVFFAYRAGMFGTM